MINLIRVLSYL